MFEIPIVDNKKRFWVTRADGGHFFDFFISNEIIALSHLDSIQITEENISREIIETIAKNLPTNKQKHSKIHQSRRFITEIKENDWVITVGKKKIAIGVIKSNAYLEGSNLLNKKIPTWIKEKSKMGGKPSQGKAYQAKLKMHCFAIKASSI